MELLFIHVVIVFTSFSVANSQDPNITSSLGEIVGNARTIPLGLPYETVHEYLGIPFAKPPVGDLRFRKPEPVTSLPSPFYAQSYSAICPQIATLVTTNDTQSEDCLYLNVYVPDRPADKPSGHAVMVWIYGGSFQEGAGSQYDFSNLTLTGNIIIVTFNYRVGVFGFLSTSDDNARGNYGLWDQRLVLEWVHDYVKDFGGDNQRVTLTGESAGAISVNLHALTPTKPRLFQRIIAQSGSVTIPFLNMEVNGLKNVLSVAYGLGCKTDSMDDLMHCLREKSVDDYLKVLGRSVVFGPILDGDFVKINLHSIAKMSESQPLDEVEFLRSLDILSGFNAYEGASLLPYVMDPTQIGNMQPTREEMRRQYLPALINLLYQREFTSELMQLVEAQYTHWTKLNDYDSIRLQIVKLGGDATYGVPAIEMARLHKMSSASRNYMYYFAPKPSVRLLPAPSWVRGANHVEELLFILGAFGTLGVGQENAWETDLIKRMMTYWTNFIKSGDPNWPESVSPYWPEYSMDTGDYLVLDKSMSNASAKLHFYAEEANFWLEVFPDLVDAVKEGDKGGQCCDGSCASAAANLHVYWTVSLALAAILCYLAVSVGSSDE